MKSSSLRWLADRFDQWVSGGLGMFSISTAQEFEIRVGRLTAHEHLEIPPYAELLLQPGLQVAIRHPEYMLVRDLGLLLDLYLDAESICDAVDWKRPPQWASTAGENVQALARAVVQACFNLLESYVSGLARAHVMSHPGIDSPTVEKLLNTREPLRRRIRLVPALIVGQECNLSPNDYPLQPLFDDVKRSRDAFVHCEPGPRESERGYVKEVVFHDVSKESVSLAVRATHDAIRQVWTFVHKDDGPRWLPEIEPSGRFGKHNLTLSARFDQTPTGSRQ